MNGYTEDDARRFIEALREVHATGHCLGGRTNEYGGSRAHSEECQDLIEADAQRRLAAGRNQ
jgi:hypothetical protein